MFQGVSVVDIEVAVRNAAQDHIHSGEIVCSRGQLLPIVVSDIRVVFQAQQKRAGTASRVGCILHIRQSEASEAAKQLGRTRRGIELTGFLSGSRGKLTDQVLVGIAQHINFGVFHAEVDFVKGRDNLRHYRAAILYSMPELCRIKLHIGK